MHPAADRSFELIKRANPDSASKSVRELIGEITSACQTCREYKSQPLRFKSSIPPEKVIFNHTVLIDLLWLDEQPVLQVIDEHTGFRNAIFLRSKKASDIWSAFVASWVSTYIGFTNKIRSDQESGINSGLFRDLATMHGVELGVFRCVFTQLDEQGGTGTRTSQKNLSNSFGSTPITIPSHASSIRHQSFKRHSWRQRDSPINTGFWNRAINR